MQLVYFNDLHKNLGCNRGITAKISIIPVTFTVLPVKFYALQLLSAPIFFCPFSPSADKCPAATDISIVQKTCVFRPVDISVATFKRSKLIYQSVYSLWEYPFRLLTAFAATFPKGSVLALSVTCGDSSPKGRALGIAIQFPAKVQSLQAGVLPREGRLPPAGGRCHRR